MDAASFVSVEILQNDENWSTTKSSYTILGLILRCLCTLSQRYLLIYVHCCFLFIYLFHLHFLYTTCVVLTVMELTMLTTPALN